MNRLEVLVLLALLLFGITVLSRPGAWCGSDGAHYDVYLQTEVRPGVHDDPDVVCDLLCGCGRRRYREVEPYVPPPPRPRAALVPLLGLILAGTRPRR